MFILVKVLIGRAVVSLDRPFSYYTLEKEIQEGERVLVSFGPSKKTTGFIVEKPEVIEEELDSYEKKNGIRLSKILARIDQGPLLTPPLLDLAKEMAGYYKSDLIRVLSSFLPPSLKPKDSALSKPQAKTVLFLFQGKELPSTKKEKEIYSSIGEDGLRKSKAGAKVTVERMLAKGILTEKDVPVSRIPELVAKKLPMYDLTKDQEEVYNHVLTDKGPAFLLEGVTGSGKTAVYIRLAENYLKNGKGVLVLVPEIALTDHMADLFESYFGDAVSVLNSSLSDARKYDEYKRIVSGEAKVVLGTRSAVFAPVKDLGLIVIDEEHSSSYKQDSVPFYDAIKVSEMRAKREGLKLLLGSATPRLLDKAKAEHGIYTPLFLNQRYSPNQTKEYRIVDMGRSENLNPSLSSFYSLPLIEEIKKNLQDHEQTMILLNRRGYSPIYVCRNCHKSVVCPNCNIPLSYHKRDDTLRCHHCGYKVSTLDYVCPSCGGKDFLSLGYGTERAYDELRLLFPEAKIYRLDSDVSNNEVRHQVLETFSEGDADILVGTQIIAKGHDFKNVTLAAMLDSDFGLRIPSYKANEDTFDLIDQFCGRAGRAAKPGRILLQTYAPENKTIQLAAKQDYAAFYAFEMEERRKYQYPPYTYLVSIQVKAYDESRAEEVGDALKEYLLEETTGKRINLYGPSAPYIPHIGGRYYRQLLLKYKSWDEMSPVLDGIKAIRLANKDTEILINVDPGSESI